MTTAMTTYAFDPVAALWVLLGVVIGLLFARLVRARPRSVPVAATAAGTAAVAAARAEADRSARDLATAQAAQRPLTDEIDRLKRELARAPRPVQAPLPGMAPMTPLEPMTPLAAKPHVAPTPPVAGAGPVVVGDADPATVPDIRQLKGVGDKFALALAGLGLGSVDRLARLAPDEAADADGRLGAFNGRIARDRLVEQATLLDEGRTTEYETRFGKLG